MKIAVIGAGAAGLVAIKHCIQEGFQCEAFEQTELVGGTWNYTDEVGLDKNGLPVHTSMYKNLRTNLPKEVMMFENFAYPDDLKESYILQSQVLDYLNAYAEKMDLRKYIKFLTLVTNVEPAADNKWNVEIQDVITKQQDKKIFDAVVVCNGKYEVPHIPEIPGLETFTGNCIHSHNYRSEEPYKDKIVLIIGGGPSGIDISIHLYQVAKKVLVCFKTSLFASLLPSELIQTPLTQRIEGNTAHFEDGSTQAIDEIILCTGYNYTFPFVSNKSKIVVDDNYISGLYKECLCTEFPTMIFLGLPGSVCPIPTFEVQMRFFIAILTGYFHLPSKKEMLKEAEDRRSAKKCSNRHFHKKGIKPERDYWDDISETAYVKKVPQVITKLHEYDVANKRNPNQSFRILNDDEFEVIA